VGKNLNNNGDVALMFELPDTLPAAHSHMGRNNAGVITYAFWDEHRVTIHAGAGPPALFAALDVVRDDGQEPSVPLGLGFKHWLKSRYPDRVLSTLAIGLVDGEGEVTVGDDDLLRFTLPMTERLRAYLERVGGIGRQIAEANGAHLLRTAGDSFEHGDAHPLGTCRTGDDADRAPCTPDGELRGHQGLFCADGSSIPGGTGVNPAHTIAANHGGAGALGRPRRRPGCSRGLRVEPAAGRRVPLPRLRAHDRRAAGPDGEAGPRVDVRRARLRAAPRRAGPGRG
jgi:hypothetical protein